MGKSGKGNGKVKVGNNVLPVNLLPYLAGAYMHVWKILVLGCTCIKMFRDVFTNHYSFYLNT